MQACWKLGRTTIRDILLEIADRPPAMSYTTVHMLLTRIVEKGYIALEQDRGNNYYAPAVDRATIVRLAAEDFVDNILAGQAENLAILDGFFEEWGDRFTWVRPRAGSVGFPRLTVPGVSVDDWAATLVEAEGVLLLPGSQFGYGGNHFRLGFGRTDLQDALDGLERHAARTLR